jgi:hypothetical protein
LAEGIFSRVDGGGTQDPEAYIERIAVGNRIVHFRQAQLLDDLHGLQRIDLGIFTGADFRHQRGVHILAVGDGGLGDAAPQLLHQHLAAPLTCDPFVIGGESHADGLHAARRPQVGDDRPACVENRGVHEFPVTLFLLNVEPFCICRTCIY